MVVFCVALGDRRRYRDGAHAITWIVFIWCDLRSEVRKMSEMDNSDDMKK